MKGAHYSSDKLQEVSTWEKCQDFSYTSPKVTDDGSGIGDDTSTLGEKCHGRPHTPRPTIHDKLHEVSVSYNKKPEEETILQEVSQAKTIQGKKTRLKDCKNIHKGSVCPGMYSPSLAEYILKPTSVNGNNNTLLS